MARKRGYFCISFIVMVALLATLLTAWAGGKPQAEKSFVQTPLLARPTVALDPINATFVGSRACQDCHAQEYKQWSASGHANMLRAVAPEIVKGDFNNQEIAYESVEVEDTNKNKVKITPKVRTETKDGKYFVSFLDADNSTANQTYEVVEVLGSLWEQQYYLKVGNKIFPSPVRWVNKDGQWRKAAFAPIWWVADGSTDGKPKIPAEMPGKQSVEFQCNGCHTTGFSAKKDEQGSYSFSRAEGGIGCENCHGAGSKHVAAQGQGSIINPAKLGTVQQEQICGQCHSRVTSKQDKDFSFPLGFKAGQTDLQDRAEFWTYSTKPTVNWPNEDAKKNRQQYHDLMKSGEMAKVPCTTCHLDHATSHKTSSLRVPRDQQCVSCHKAQATMFEGSLHAQKGVVCVDCHMAKMGNRTGATQKTPKEPFDVTAHTMSVITPQEAETFKMRSSCEKCHKDTEKLSKGASMLGTQQVVQQAIAKTSSAKTDVALKAKDNLYRVLLDGSMGVHNPEKTINLLK